MTLSNLPSRSLFLTGGNQPAHRVVSDLANEPRQYELNHIELSRVGDSIATMLRYHYRPAIILSQDGKVIRGHKVLAILRAVHADSTVAYDLERDDFVRLDADNPNHINTTLLGNRKMAGQIMTNLDERSAMMVGRAMDVLNNLEITISRVDRGHTSARELAALFKSLED